MQAEAFQRSIKYQDENGALNNDNGRVRQGYELLTFAIPDQKLIEKEFSIHARNIEEERAKSYTEEEWRQRIPNLRYPAYQMPHN